MKYEVIFNNAQVLVAPGKKKLSPGLPLGLKFTAKSFQGGGVFFDPDGRYPYDEVWTDLDNVQVVAESPPSVHKTATITVEVFSDGSYQIHEQSY